MERINITETDDDYGVRVVGWFDYDKAERFTEDTEWNGSNHISVNTGSQWNHQMLLRTKQGRWVLMVCSDYQGTLPSFEFAGEQAAREWLILNKQDTAAERFFGEVEEERGPGRPAIGEAINIRLGDELLTAVDARAAAAGKTRAETIRALVAAAVGGSGGSPSA